MRLKILVILLLSAATALADDLTLVQQREQEASTRVWYHEAQASIAERDVATAQLRLQTAIKQHNKSLREKATQEDVEARTRLGMHVRELDQARKALQVATEERARLERVSRRR